MRQDYPRQTGGRSTPKDICGHRCRDREAYRYADEFVAVCYKYNEQTGEHEQRTPSELPFADVQYSDDGEFATYTYGGCSETVPTKKFYDGANKLEKTIL